MDERFNAMNGRYFYGLKFNGNRSQFVDFSWQTNFQRVFNTFKKQAGLMHISIVNVFYR